MAEEDIRVPGAYKMVELGCMEGVDEVYALHNDASFRLGPNLTLTTASCLLMAQLGR